MTTIKPYKLEQGGCIGIISPASEIYSFPRRLERAVKSLTSSGFKVELGRNALKKHGYEAGTPQDRADDIHSFFKSHHINAILCATGGYTSNTVLKYLDFNLIKNNPKPLIGFSDATALLLGVYCKANITTFHGLSLLPSFGDKNGVHPDSLLSFQDALCNLEKERKLRLSFDQYSDENLSWDGADDRARLYLKDEGAICLNGGVAKGRLMGGNLDTLIGIIGSEYCPDFTGSLLFLEENAGTVSKTLRNLQSLEYSNLLSKAVGIVWGRCCQYNDNPSPYDLQTYLAHLGVKYDIPVVYNAPIGHTEPKITIPIGVEALLNADLCELTILETSVI